MAFWQNEEDMDPIEGLGWYSTGIPNSSLPIFQPNNPNWNQVYGHRNGQTVQPRRDVYTHSSAPTHYDMPTQQLYGYLNGQPFHPPRVVSPYSSAPTHYDMPTQELYGYLNGQPFHPPRVVSPYSSAPTLFDTSIQNGGNYPSCMKSDRMIPLHNTKELEKTIRKMDRNSRYYIGYTSQGHSSYLCYTHPKSNGWMERAHYRGKPVKIGTYYVELKLGDETEDTLISRYGNDRRCLNDARGVNYLGGIVYLLEYNYYG